MGKFILSILLVSSFSVCADNNILRMGNSVLKDMNQVDTVGEVNEPFVPLSCSDILEEGLAQGDGIYSIYPNGSEEKVFCDMTRAGGGWQLITAITKNSRPSSLQTIADYPSDIMRVGSLDNPSSEYMYKSSLSRFGSVRESVGCTSIASCAHAFGANFSNSELETIRTLTTSTARSNIMQSEIPNCSVDYQQFVAGNNTHGSCDGSGRTGNTYLNRISGWQTDVHGVNYCWFMRSMNAYPDKQGSGRCATSADANGTRHATLWMR